MRARIGAGIAGWLAGLLPLGAVNVAAYTGVFAYQSTASLGLFALVGGLALGGVCAGGLGARRGGGLRGAIVGGSFAAFLFAATIIGLMYGTGYFTYAPPLIAQHPVRVSGAVVFCSLLLLGIATGAGALVSRRDAASAPAPRMPQSRPRPTYSDPRDYPRRSPSAPTPRGARGSGPRERSDPQMSQGGRGNDAVYAGGRRGAGQANDETEHARDPRHQRPRR